MQLQKSQLMLKSIWVFRILKVELFVVEFFPKS